MDLSNKTKISLSIGAIVTALATIGGGAYNVAVYKTTQDNKDSNYEKRTAALEEIARSNIERSDRFSSALLTMQEEMRLLVKDRFTMPMAAEVALRTKLANPSMTVIDPRDNRPIITDNPR